MSDQDTLLEHGTQQLPDLGEDGQGFRWAGETGQEASEGLASSAKPTAELCQDAGKRDEEQTVRKAAEGSKVGVGEDFTWRSCVQHPIRWEAFRRCRRQKASTTSVRP